MYAENTFLRNTLSVGYCVFHTPILWGLSVGAMSRHHFHRGVFRWQCGIHTRRLMVDIWICNRFRLSKVTLPHLSTYVLKLERSPTIGAKGRVQKKMREKYGLLPNLPRTPLPGFGLFSKKKLTPIFCCWKMH